MANIPRPTGDVLRRNAEQECGTPVGQLTIKIQGIQDFQVVSFYCNKSRLHTDKCAFIGSNVVVEARRREDQADSIILKRP